MKRTLVVNPTTPFDDAAEPSVQYPDAFLRPDPSDLKQVGGRDMVKVSTGGERFWCEVLERNGEVLLGRIDNDLVCSEVHGLYFNDVVQFERKNIYQIAD